MSLARAARDFFNDFEALSAGNFEKIPDPYGVTSAAPWVGPSEILTIFFGIIGQVAHEEIFDHFWAGSERIGQIIYIGK